MDNKRNKKFLLGIKGKIGAGKTESAKILKKHFPSMEYAMADPIKQIGRILGFSDEELYGTQKQKLQKNKYWGISSREFLQTFGTEVCRNFLPTVIPQMNNIWVRNFEIFCQKNQGNNIIVSDVRFLDEAASIKKLGGIIIEVQRPDLKSADVLSHNIHQSETEQDQIESDYLIMNNSTIKHLQEELIKVVNQHLLG